MKEGETGARPGNGQVARKPRRLWRLAYVVPLYLVGGIFALVAILAVAGAWRLSEGPISTGFMSPYLESAIGGLPEGWRLEIGDTGIAWDGTARTVNLTAADVTFINAENQRVLTVPEIAFSLYGEALIKRRLRPREVTARGVNLLLTRTEDGGFAMGLAHSPDPGTEPTRPVPEVVADVFGIGSKGEDTAQRLRSVTLENSKVQVVDQIRNRVFRLDGRLIRIVSSEDHLSVEGSVDLNARQLTVPLWVELDYRPEGERAKGLARFQSVQPAAFVDALDAPVWLAGIRFPVSGVARFAYSADAGPEPLALRLSGGEGEFELAGHLPGPVPVKHLEFEGAIDIPAHTLHVDRARYDSGGFVAEATGTAHFREAGPDLDMTITGRDIDSEHLGAYWPPHLAGEVRGWLLDHLQGGRADAITADLNIRAEMWHSPQPPDDAFRIDATFSGGAIRLYPPFDPVTGGEGRFSVTGHTFDLALSAGRLGKLALSEGHVRIPDFTAGPPVLSAEFVARGSIAETVGAVLRPPISDALDAPAVLRGIAGNAASRVRLEVPVHPGAALTDTDFVATANLTDVAAEDFWAGRTLRADKLELRVDRAGAELNGRVAAADAWFDVNWIEHFGARGAARREVAFSGLAQSSVLVEQGLAPAGWIDGQTGLSGRATVDDSGQIAARVDADLGAAALDLPEIGWRKPSGTPARLSLDYSRDSDGGVRLENLSFAGPGLELDGSARLGADGALSQADLDRLVFGETDIALRLARSKTDAWQADISGARLDLRPWTADADDDVDALEELEGAEVAMNLDEVRLTDATRFDDFRGSFTIADGWPVGRADGMVNGKAPVSFTASAAKEGWDFELTADNAGNALSAAGMLDAIDGGTLKVDGVAAGPQNISGVARVSDFTLKETPGFARLLSLASLSGFADALSGRGLSFSLAEIPFEYESGQLNIRKGRMVGSSVGLTAEGYYVPRTEELRLVGNLIPAYTLSRVLGAIPLVGEILGGDQGLFGVTYVVEGNAGDPDIKVNPLSALAPGILRRMFLAPIDPSEQPLLPPEPPPIPR